MAYTSWAERTWNILTVDSLYLRLLEFGGLYVPNLPKESISARGNNSSNGVRIPLLRIA